MKNCNGCNVYLEKKKELHQFLLDNPCEGYQPRSCGNCGNCITDEKSSICFELGRYLSDIALHDNRNCMTWVKAR